MLFTMRGAGASEPQLEGAAARKPKQGALHIEVPALRSFEELQVSRFSRSFNEEQIESWMAG